MKAPYTMFGKTREIPVRVYVDGHLVDGTSYDDQLWVERGEDWYAFMSPQLRGKRVRVVTREAWLQAEDF